MDHMERWGRIGGSDFIVGFMEYAPDGGCNPLNNCGTFGLKNSSRDTQSPKWLGCVSMCLRWSCQHSSASYSLLRQVAVSSCRVVVIMQWLWGGIRRPVGAFGHRHRCRHEALMNVLHASRYKAYLAGEVGGLPFTSADLPPTPAVVCTPSCVWGVCTRASNSSSSAGVCDCFAGVSGAACTVFGPKPSDCAAGGTAWYQCYRATTATVPLAKSLYLQVADRFDGLGVGAMSASCHQWPVSTLAGLRTGVQSCRLSTP